MKIGTISKRVTSILLAAILVLGMTACGSDSTSSTGSAAAESSTQTDSGSASADSTASTESGDDAQFDGEIVIGACSDLTGTGAANGEGEAFAYQMIADEINAAGGVLGKKLVVIQEDTNGTAEGAVNAINRQLSNPDVVAVLGFMYSSHVMAISDIVKEAQIPVMYGGSSPTINELGNPYLFRMRPADDFVVELAMDYVSENFKPQKLGILYSMSDFGTQGYEVAKKYCEENGIDYVADGFTDGTKDFYSNILKLKDAGCDSMLWWAFEEELAYISRQRLELEYDVPVFGCATVGNVQYALLASNEDSEGIMGIAESADGNDWPYYTEFAERYEAGFGLVPNNNVCSLGPAVYLLADAIERAGTSEAEALCEALRQTKNFPSLSGYLTCDEKQNLNHNSVIYRMTGGNRQFVELFVQDVA